MKKSNISMFTLICYVAAALVGIVGIYMVWVNIASISEYLAAYGMSFGDMKGAVIQTLAPVFAQYFTYALVLVAAGKIYQAVKNGITFEEDFVDVEEIDVEEYLAEAGEVVCEEPVCEEAACEACAACAEEAVEATEVVETVEAPVEEAVTEPKED